MTLDGAFDSRRLQLAGRCPAESSADRLEDLYVSSPQVATLVVECRSTGMNDTSKRKQPGAHAFELWNYFYLLAAPRAGDEKPWRRIECATMRIRHSAPLLAEQHPPAVRTHHARRVRRRCREIARCVDALTVVPPMWTAESVGQLRGYAEATIKALEDSGADLYLH